MSNFAKLQCHFASLPGSITPAALREAEQIALADDGEVDIREGHAIADAWFDARDRGEASGPAAQAEFMRLVQAYGVEADRPVEPAPPPGRYRATVMGDAVDSTAATMEVPVGLYVDLDPEGNVAVRASETPPRGLKILSTEFDPTTHRLTVGGEFRAPSPPGKYLNGFPPSSAFTTWNFTGVVTLRSQSHFSGPDVCQRVGDVPDRKVLRYTRGQAQVTESGNAIRVEVRDKSGQVKATWVSTDGGANWKSKGGADAAEALGYRYQEARALGDRESIKNAVIELMGQDLSEFELHNREEDVVFVSVSISGVGPR